MTEPLSGLDPTPTSCTESPSGSIPFSGTVIRTDEPATTRAVTVCGTGGLFVAASRSRTEIETAASAYWPSGPATR